MNEQCFASENRQNSCEARLYYCHQPLLMATNSIRDRLARQTFPNHRDSTFALSLPILPGSGVDDIPQLRIHT